MTDPIPEKALIVVADGGRAVFFRNTGKAGAISLYEERVLVPHTEDDQGPSGSRPVEQTVRQTEKATFVNVIAHALHAMVGQGEFKDLMLVAPPQILGELRAAIHKSVEATVFRTLSKDLTGHPTKNIAEALAT